MSISPSPARPPATVARILACRSIAALSRLTEAWRAEGVTLDAEAQAVMDAHQRRLVKRGA